MQRKSLGKKTLHGEKKFWKGNLIVIINRDTVVDWAKGSRNN